MSIFKKGDKVYDYAYGWGEVSKINEVVDYYPLLIEFQHIKLYYNFKGVSEFGLLPTLAFYDYTLEGFSQVRPKEPLPFKVGDVVYVSDTALSRWVTCQLTSINSDNGDKPFCTGSDWKYIALENPLLNPDTIIYTKEDL
jgi:hypothetical protein